MTVSSQKRRALVVGGSLAGLMAGLLLRRAGWDVDVYERVPEDMSERGGGIATQDAMWASFTRAGLDVAERPGVRIERRVVFGRDGAVLAEKAIAETVSSWDTIYRLMLGAFPGERYHLGRGVASVEQDDVGVTAVFEDGTRETADLLVAADGAGSTVRRTLLPAVRSGYANYIAWRGLVDEADLPEIARENLAGLWSFCVPPGEQMLSYTVPGAGGALAEGERRHNFVWYQPAEPGHVLPDLLTDASGQEHRPNIPPPAIRPERSEAMRAHADAVLSPAYAAFVRATRQPFLQPIADHLSPRFAFGRVVLIGDAAAQARPHVGAGTSKAIADAEALADALGAHDGVPDALAAYEAARLPLARRMVEQGRWLGRGLDPAVLDKGDGSDQAHDTLIEVTARGLVDLAARASPPADLPRGGEDPLCLTGIGSAAR